MCLSRGSSRKQARTGPQGISVSKLSHMTRSGYGYGPNEVVALISRIIGADTASFCDERFHVCCLRLPSMRDPRRYPFLFFFCFLTSRNDVLQSVRRKLAVNVRKWNDACRRVSRNGAGVVQRREDRPSWKKRAAVQCVWRNCDENRRNRLCRSTSDIRRQTFSWHLSMSSEWNRVLVAREFLGRYQNDGESLGSIVDTRHLTPSSKKFETVPSVSKTGPPLLPPVEFMSRRETVNSTTCCESLEKSRNNHKRCWPPVLASCTRPRAPFPGTFRLFWTEYCLAHAVRIIIFIVIIIFSLSSRSSRVKNIFLTAKSGETDGWNAVQGAGARVLRHRRTKADATPTER